MRISDWSSDVCSSDLSMDWQTLVSRRAKKDKPSQGGWNAFLTSWVAADILNPISAAGFNTDCEKSWFGWPCDEEMEKLREAFATENDGAKQKNGRASGRESVEQ